MSLGLFNCRLIQTAGDQLFFLSAVLHQCQFGASSVQSPCDPSCSAPTSGRAQHASCSSFSEGFCLGFSKGAKPPSGAGDSHRFSYEFPRRSSILPIDSATEPDIYSSWWSAEPGQEFNRGSHLFTGCPPEAIRWLWGDFGWSGDGLGCGGRFSRDLQICGLGVLDCQPGRDLWAKNGP